ncbi:DUF732 domain-containing protein [Mycolicibacterium sp. ND9-15]|uniref:DUF732 domain-containing protein n=1 Tax=Mycolicibacterium sp. ND9-15 TaxID=3042320 RepID=UPI002DDBB632|nr:DUF732 domain-containing protein [Mycolicibacterium sp. ND9-15]WSE55212.1 DUF732 domain-containing protein [Mycolicibacterium sp. ND9-15]
MRRIIGVWIAAIATAVAFAAPAAADQSEFVRKLRERYVFLTAEQLITAGHDVCAAARSGVPASDSVIMVRDSLGISIKAAGDIVSRAVVELGC